MNQSNLSIRDQAKTERERRLLDGLLREMIIANSTISAHLHVSWDTRSDSGKLEQVISYSHLQMHKIFRLTILRGRSWGNSSWLEIVVRILEEFVFWTLVRYLGARPGLTTVQWKSRIPSPVVRGSVPYSDVPASCPNSEHLLLIIILTESFL
jgi:hypothetical protein